MRTTFTSWMTGNLDNARDTLKVFYLFLIWKVVVEIYEFEHGHGRRDCFATENCPLPLIFSLLFNTLETYGVFRRESMLISWVFLYHLVVVVGNLLLKIFPFSTQGKPWAAIWPSVTENGTQCCGCMVAKGALLWLLEGVSTRKECSGASSPSGTNLKWLPLWQAVLLQWERNAPEGKIGTKKIKCKVPQQ